MEKIKVSLGENSYYIYIGYHLEKIKREIEKLNFGNKFVILSDKNVFKLYGEIVKKTLENKTVHCIVLSCGEKQKNFNNVLKIINQLVKFKINRDDTIINLGGGVINDIGGFVSSIYMRGIKYISIPTTLLAQVDASIGGKTGINLKFGKNLIGTFYQPSLVYIDLNTLDTLPYREIKQGIAELIKYGVIKNEKIFETLEKVKLKELKDNYEFLVKESVKVKVDVVEKDEKEKKGLREILNFGHTLGHGIEITNIKKFSHGDAVCLGMIGESYIAFKKGLCDNDVYIRIKNLGRKFKLKTSFEKLDLEKVIEFMKYDKKIKKGNLRFVLPEKIGKVIPGV
ncbi:MAG: 3-dehydroquinate synthase, partial [bacterium]|nr:3-dehydroquinate synthase [bacterium]MDW8164419.1 3-dehydroquinate synthase [Candidatus Omnitrophota bacterium]